MKDKDINAGNMYKINDIEHDLHGKGVHVIDITPSNKYFEFFVEVEENPDEKLHVRSDQLAPYFAEIPGTTNWMGYQVGDNVKVRPIGSQFDDMPSEIVEIIDDEYVVIRLKDNDEQLSINTNNIVYDHEQQVYGVVGDPTMFVGGNQEGEGEGEQKPEIEPVAIIDLETQQHFYYTDDVLMRMHEQDRMFYVVGSDGSLLESKFDISFKKVK